MSNLIARGLLTLLVGAAFPLAAHAQFAAPAQPLPQVAPMPPVAPPAGERTTASVGAPRALSAPGAAKSAQPVQTARVQPGAPGGDLTPEQREALQRVNTYFNSVTTLVGNFVQVGPDRSRLEGDFYMHKPGRVRFDYDPPSPIQLVADGRDVVVRDRKLATQDLYPLSQTPLRFLLSDKLDLMKDTNVIGVYKDDLFINVVIEEKHALVGTHRLMLMFGAEDSELKQWTITDPQGYDTTIAIFNLDQTKTPDPSMFRIEVIRPD